MQLPKLISLLEELRIKLNKSGTERTTGLFRTMGDDCFYYKKSLDLFERNDYDQIKTLLLSCLEEIKIIEGGK